MLQTDSLMEVIEIIPGACNNSAIRKTSFDVTINNELYADTCCALSEKAIVLRVNVKDEVVMLRVKFCFALLFQVEEKTDEWGTKEVNSIILQRNNKKMALSSNKNVKQLILWCNFLERTLNQRGFHNKFSAIKKIGKGNFATVYLINKIDDKSRYAVKSFSKELLQAEEKGKESLINELSLMRKFTHKNIIKLEAVYETDHSIYLVLQLLEGGLLSEKIARKQKASTLEIKMIMKGLLEGLQAMHKKNVMHRDLKPENILLRKENDCECVIADFGLAEEVHAEEYLFVRCGTPGFVAPEIVNLKDYKAKYTCACDLFSLGIIFHMLLLKKSPFTGKEYNEILSQNRACNFNFDSFEYRQLSEASLHLLQRLLEKDPAKRITASEALKHAFFYSQFTIWENKKGQPRDKKEESVEEEVESPVVIKRSAERKKMTHIRGDSCLKFKMKENMMLSKITSEDSGTNITSPQFSVKSVKFGGSRFKKMPTKTDK